MFNFVQTKSYFCNSVHTILESIRFLGYVCESHEKDEWQLTIYNGANLITVFSAYGIVSKITTKIDRAAVNPVTSYTALQLNISIWHL